MSTSGLTSPEIRRPFELKILLVDDHVENLLALESVLSDLGQSLVKARSGREALREVLEDDFAVILMDVQMPGMNGFDTASLIRSRERSQYTPILFLTAYNKSDDHVSTGYSVGAIDYVFKPFQPEILRAKVHAFVELSRKTRELEDEIKRRNAAELEVHRLNSELEKRVRQRTAQLEASNRKLKREIVDRKRVENDNVRHQRSIESLNQRLQRAMTETHHRVKNNLQIIAAMVETYLVQDNRPVSADAANRLGIHIQSLAAIHELLTQEAKDDGQAHDIPVQKVLEKLIELVQGTADPRRIKHDFADLRLSAKQGTSLALVVNELLNNAIKYSDGDIEVSLSVSNNRAALRVLDSGPGFADGFDAVVQANTGLELVQSLSHWDLGGDVEFSTREAGGGCVTVTLPVHI